MSPDKSVGIAVIEYGLTDVLVGLSGGADSVCLMLALLGCGVKVTALHVNHMIRGDEAYRDEEFCRSLCASRSVPFYCERIDVPSLSASCGKGIEETAREARYEAFCEAADRLGIPFIATAHNADDNAETVVFNIVRGASPDGISGIPRRRGNIVRPLLFSTRAEIELYLSECGQQFVTDSTNSDDSYTRNLIRSRVMPVLRSINPAVSESFLRLSRLAAADREYFGAAIDSASGIRPAELPYSLLSRLVVKRYKEFTGRRGITASQVDAICAAVSEYKCASFDLPGACCSVGYGNFRFCSGSPDTSGYSFPVSEGLNYVPGGNTALYFGCPNVYKLSTSVHVDCDKIQGNVYARNRLPGDRIVCLSVSKSVRKEIINKKIPRRLRRSVPVVCDSEGIIYVPYIGAADRVYTAKSDSSVIGLINSETEILNEEE